MENFQAFILTEIGVFLTSFKSHVEEYFSYLKNPNGVNTAQLQLKVGNTLQKIRAASNKFKGISAKQLTTLEGTVVDVKLIPENKYSRIDKYLYIYLEIGTIKHNGIEQKVIGRVALRDGNSESFNEVSSFMQKQIETLQISQKVTLRNIYFTPNPFSKAGYEETAISENGQYESDAHKKLFYTVAGIDSNTLEPQFIEIFKHTILYNNSGDIVLDFFWSGEKKTRLFYTPSKLEEFLNSTSLGYKIMRIYYPIADFFAKDKHEYE